MSVSTADARQSCRVGHVRRAAAQPRVAQRLIVEAAVNQHAGRHRRQDDTDELGG
jgi:hypothetical protein